MCDQIGAEIAVRTLGTEGEAQGRTFMEFTIRGDKGHYEIDPFPFVEEAIELQLEYYVVV
jgi:hypothetical protein